MTEQFLGKLAIDVEQQGGENGQNQQQSVQNAVEPDADVVTGFLQLLGPVQAAKNAVGPP